MANYLHSWFDGPNRHLRRAIARTLSALHALFHAQYHVAGITLAAILFSGGGLQFSHAQIASEVDIGQRRGSFTPGELALLPPYCHAMQGSPDYTGPGGARWRAWLGNDLQHIHHYCRGLRDVIFATFVARIPPHHRSFLWERAVDEYDYMLRNSAPTMPLLPEIHFKRGEALLKLGRVFEAEESFTRAWKLKPDYWEPYAAWADKLVELKMYDRARDTLENGLAQAPQAVALQQRLQRLPGTIAKPTTVPVPMAKASGAGG